MKSITVLALLVVVGLCVAVEGRTTEEAAERTAVPRAPLAVDLSKLDNVQGLTKERLEQFRQAIEAFKAKIDATRMNSAHREAIKKDAMERLAQRIAKLKQTPQVEA
uniref:Uncharacterized protein n=1 Tax=Anopheles atroparvus TaxID=41427 RepID=A0A182IUC3_ANOAO